MRFIDLFCGIGTIRMGFEKAGHECVWSCEWDKHKRKIYSIIFGREPEGADIRKVQACDIARSECWCFGFPCQDISIAKHSGRLGLGGERSGLFYEVFRLLKDTKKEDRPKYLLVENVKNLLSINNRWDFFNLTYSLDELGYDAEWELLNSKDFTPQNRERLFIVGHLRDRSTRKIFPLEITQNNNYLKFIGGFKTGKLWLDKRKNYSKNFSQGTRVYSSDGISCTLSAHGGGLGAKTGLYIVNGRVRKLTPKEAWRLQGIPDEITNKVITAGISDTQMYTGAGDACTVPVVYEIAKRL